jgi:hypothetical protein
MKTLNQINEDIRVAVEARMEKLRANGLLTFDEQSEDPDLQFEPTVRKSLVDVEVNERFVKLFDIVEKLDEYLQLGFLDEKTKRQSLRKQLKEMIEEL